MFGAHNVKLKKKKGQALDSRPKLPTSPQRELCVTHVFK